MAALLDKFRSLGHVQGDWYEALLFASLDETRGDMKSAIRLADTAFSLHRFDSIRMAILRAPKGYTKERPLIIKGIPFIGGQFIPSAIAKAAPAHIRETLVRAPGREIRLRRMPISRPQPARRPPISVPVKQAPVSPKSLEVGGRPLVPKGIESPVREAERERKRAAEPPPERLPAEGAAEPPPERRGIIGTIQDRIVAQWNRLPKAIRGPVAAIGRASFVTYIAGQRAARGLAREIGGEKHAERVGRTVTIIDTLAMAVPVPKMGIPVGSALYLAYATAAHPKATISAVAQTVKKKKEIEPRSDDEKALHGMIDEGTRNLPGHLRRIYEGTVKEVISRMPENVVRGVAKNMKGVAFYPNLAALNDANMTPERKRKLQAEGIENPVLYGLNGSDGFVHLDDPENETRRSGIYAHQLTHLLDERRRFSDSPKWKKAWQEEMVGKKSAKFKYAAKNPAEGFAEFGRFLYSRPMTRARSAKIRAMLPKASALWRNFWPKEIDS